MRERVAKAARFISVGQHLIHGLPGSGAGRFTDFLLPRSSIW